MKLFRTSSIGDFRRKVKVAIGHPAVEPRCECRCGPHRNNTDAGNCANAGIVKCLLCGDKVCRECLHEVEIVLKQKSVDYEVVADNYAICAECKCLPHFRNRSR